eukprot:SAG31_NODE_936_length_10870_cov_5.136966_5_plen_298_part_00
MSQDLAFFFDVLNGDGKARSTVSLGTSRSRETVLSLYNSIKQTEQLDASQGDEAPYTEKQLTDVIDHMVDMVAQQHLHGLPHRKCQELHERDARFDIKTRTYGDNVHFSEWKMEDIGGHTFADRLDSIWSVYYDIFKSNRIYGANLENLGAVALLIDQIVKRDKLPTNNSLESQRQLRNAWNTIDICAYNAHQYKLMHKIFSALQLVLGTAIVVMTIIHGSASECEPEESDDSTINEYQMAVLFTSAALTLVTATTAFYSPKQRWKQLRAVAELLQSDIFQFRTRTGPFTGALFATL